MTDQEAHAGEVEVHGIRALRGPNLYAYMPVLEVTLAAGRSGASWWTR